MKLTIILALIAATTAVVTTEGCISVPDDETSISLCSCHADCKLCGYGDDTNHPTGVNQCLTCNKADFVSSGGNKPGYC